MTGGIDGMMAIDGDNVSPLQLTTAECLGPLRWEHPTTRARTFGAGVVGATGAGDRRGAYLEQDRVRVQLHLEDVAGLRNRRRRSAGLTVRTGEGRGMNAGR